MKPLAPIVDQIRILAREELPAPRTCKIRLWDDGTFDVHFYHSHGNEKQFLRYDRTTSEILWEKSKGGSWRAEPLSGNETVYEPVVAKSEVRVVARVEPPYE